MKTTNILFGVLVLIGLHAQAQVNYQEYTKGKVTFLTAVGMSPEQFNEANYKMKPDAAYIEKRFASRRGELDSLNAADFSSMTQEEMDQIYMRSFSGPIIPGDYLGSVEMKGVLAGQIKNTLVSRMPGSFLIKKFEAACKNDFMKCFAESIWGGKQIRNGGAPGDYYLRNAIDPVKASAFRVAISGVMQSISAVWNGNATWKTMGTFNNEKRDMLFPAKVYCGQSLFDHRKESIIIDYLWGNDYAGGSYKEPWIHGIDDLTGAGYLDIRDEVRMVRPGLYLGRAYTNKIFLLNFVLQNSKDNTPEIKNVRRNACFDGSQSK